MKTKKLIITLLMMTSILILLMPNSNAVLNSNGSTAHATRPAYWITPIRQLETLGGGMGLTETLNDDLSSSSGSNNIDVHMEKNTEYGALAILTVSSYGNPNTVTAHGTSTGNETGVVYGSLAQYGYASANVYGEAVASASYYSYQLNQYNVTFETVNKKYVNNYVMNNANEQYPYKIGDAMQETKGWQNSREYQVSSGSSYNFFRSNGSIFSYYAFYWDHQQIFGTARAAVVCGEGI